MDTKDILRATEITKRLIQDEEYYKYIFKKTERIVSVVFYISHNLEINKKSQMHIEDIQHSARVVHDAVLQSLQTRAHVAEDAIRDTAHALITLESKMRVAQVSGIVTTDVMNVLAGEIDAVLRGMNKYLKMTNAIDDLDYQIPSEMPLGSSKKTVAHTSVKRTTPSQISEGVMSRRERIKTVLEAKGEASIKDIAEIITDCSEKTIQRELNAMIEDNVIKRQGERRWSRYTLF